LCTNIGSALRSILTVRTALAGLARNTRQHAAQGGSANAACPPRLQSQMPSCRGDDFVSSHGLTSGSSSSLMCSCTFAGGAAVALSMRTALPKIVSPHGNDYGKENRGQLGWQRCVHFDASASPRSISVLGTSHFYVNSQRLTPATTGRCEDCGTPESVSGRISAISWMNARSSSIPGNFTDATLRSMRTFTASFALPRCAPHACWVLTANASRICF
jgi:hypothetical protein